MGQSVGRDNAYMGSRSPMTALHVHPYKFSVKFCFRYTNCQV
jgi:hypothetical protein